jgi:hypothetical protein
MELLRCCPFAHLHWLWEFNFGQMLWDKVWFYPEYIGEHILGSWETSCKHIGNMFGMRRELDMNTLRTSWELDENTMIFNPKNSNLPTSWILEGKNITRKNLCSQLEVSPHFCDVAKVVIIHKPI